MYSRLYFTTKQLLSHSRQTNFCISSWHSNIKLNGSTMQGRVERYNSTESVSTNRNHGPDLTCVEAVCY